MHKPDEEAHTETDLTSRKEQRRMALLNAALLVFSRDGFSGAKIDDVASEAGMGKGTVYLYASSKLALLQDVIQEKILPLVQDVERLKDAHTGSAIELLTLQIRRFFSEILNEDRRKLFRLIMAEGIHYPEVRDFYVNNVALRTQQTIKDTLEMGVRTGEFRDIDMSAVPQSIFGGILAAGLWRNFLSPHEPPDLDYLCEVHLGIILHGLCREGAPRHP